MANCVSILDLGGRVQMTGRVTVEFTCPRCGARQTATVNANTDAEIEIGCRNQPCCGGRRAFTLSLSVSVDAVAQYADTGDIPLRVCA